MTDTDTITITPYEVWRNTPGRDLASAARILSMPESTIRTLHREQDWQARARDDDAADIASIADAAIVTLSHMVPTALETIGVVFTARFDASGKPSHTVTPIAARMAWELLRLFGINPARVSALMIQADTNAPSVTAALLADLIASGDTASLLALAQGRDAPARHNPATGEAPTDFLSTYAAGREGLARYPSVTQDPAQVTAAVALQRKREVSPEEWDTMSIIEGEIRETARGKRKRTRSHRGEAHPEVESGG